MHRNLPQSVLDICQAQRGQNPPREWQVPITGEPRRPPQLILSLEKGVPTPAQTAFGSRRRPLTLLGGDGFSLLITTKVTSVTAGT